MIYFQMEYVIVDKTSSKLNPYPYVYVLENGSIRELTKSEKEYLETPFHPGDSGRPYVKDSYNSKDGWGKISGFCARYLVPTNKL
jgi:hypothetical protein